MSITGIVDIGTNSVKLTIADVGGTIHLLKEDSRVTRLGKSVDRDGRLGDDAVKATIDAVQQFVIEAQSAGATVIKAAGTSALRDATNGREFIEKVKSSTGIQVEIIAGEREADLAFAAIAGDPDLDIQTEVNMLVFDIGGGSTELMVGRHSHANGHVSLNVGALRLTERYFSEDPPSEKEIGEARAFARHSILSGFSTDNVTISSTFGVGGTATTYASLMLNTKDVHGKSLHRADLETKVRCLQRLTLSQLKTIPLLEPARADIIVAGGLILLSVLDVFSIGEFRVSVRGMRYGLLVEELAH